MSIYAVQESDGSLLWYRHDAWRDGGSAWTPKAAVGNGWTGFRQVFAGGEGVIYAIQESGDLLWYRHDGHLDGSLNWANDSKKNVGNGWNFEHVWSAGEGVIYAVEARTVDPRSGQRGGGDLLWYRHEDWRNGGPSWSPKAVVGKQWRGFRQVFSGGDGVIYAIKENGELLWYRHDGQADGTFRWARGSGEKIDNGWNFEHVWSPGEGVIYAVTARTIDLGTGRRSGGDLFWCRHDGWRDGGPAWASKRKVGNGWNGFQHVFSDVVEARPTALHSHQWCSFEAEATSGGIVPKSYTLKGAGRGNSQMTWRYDGPDLAGVPMPVPFIAAAFATWSSASGRTLGFTQVTTEADIVIRSADLGGIKSNGTAILGQWDGSAFSFNSNKAISWSPTQYQNIATHEIGHALGLLHATTNDSIMYPFDDPGVGIHLPSRDDIAAVRALYGWTGQRSLEGGTEHPPALCDCGGTLALAWRGTRGDNNIYFATSTDGETFTPQRSISGAATEGGPALAWDGTRLWMAWRGARDDTSLYWARTTDFFNGNWTGVQSLSDRGSTHGPRIVAAPAGTVMVWKGSGSDRSLWWALWDEKLDRWGQQLVIGGTASVASPAVCRDLDPNQIRMVWRGSEGDDSLYMSTLNGPLGTRAVRFWQPQTPVSWIIAGNGGDGSVDIGRPGSADGPTVTFTGDRIIAGWRGVPDDSGLYFSQFATDRVGTSVVNQWSSQALIPNVGSMRCPAIANFNGRLRAVWRGIGDDNGLWTASL